MKLGGSIQIYKQEIPCLCCDSFSTDDFENDLFLFTCWNFLLTILIDSSYDLLDSFTNVMKMHYI